MFLPAMKLLALVFGVASGAPDMRSASGESQQPVPAPVQVQRKDETAVDDIVVVTASRREERLLNAPATMSVLTDEAIGYAPARSVTDMLRLVPGLNTVQTSARDINVTSRAATGTLADSLLVLLDGPSMYQDFFGFVAWDLLPVDSNEIKQIEVIRGPASAVWGANAMTGVVNVLTKAPREMLGTSVVTRFGQFDRSRAGGTHDRGGLFSISATHAQATSDRFAYKVSAGLFMQEPFPRPTGFGPDERGYPGFENQGTLQPKLDARVDYDLADLADGRQQVILAGGISGTEGIIHTGLGPLDVQRGSTLKYGRMTYTRRRLKLQVFVNALDGRALALLQQDEDGQLDLAFENQAYDVEVSNLYIWRSHLLSYGGNYRHNNFDISFARRGASRDEGGGYLQDEIFLSERVRWIVGTRVDVFDILQKAVLSPRTTLLLKPEPNQTFRLSYNRAFRAPSFVNSYFDTQFLQSVDLGPAGRFPLPVRGIGNEDLNAEVLTACEAGYIGGFGRTTLGAAVYVNDTRNMIQFTQTGTYTSSAPPPGWPINPAVLDQLAASGQGLPSQVSYRNFDRISDRGLELSADVRMTATTSAFANYTWQADPKPTGFDVSEINLPPTHRFNAGCNIARGRYFGSLSASFVDAAFWQDVNPVFEGWTKAHTLVDGGIDVHSADGKMTVAVRGTNLLNRAVQQHAFGDIIKRAFTGEMRVKF